MKERELPMDCEGFPVRGDVIMQIRGHAKCVVLGNDDFGAQVVPIVNGRLYHVGWLVDIFSFSNYVNVGKWDFDLEMEVEDE